MKSATTYLMFDGNAHEAMTFYAKCLDAQLEMSKFSEAPCDSPAAAKDRIMHASLTNGKVGLMASDTMPGMPFQVGNNFSIAIHCDSVAEADKLFADLGQKGKVTMPLQDTFWGAYFGMVTDQFGVNWMFNFEKPKQG
jgi:PhnB protein